MTDAMLLVAQNAVRELTFEGWTSHDGPTAIQGPEDGAMATPPLLALIDQAKAQDADGIIIGCFDDTALCEAARRFDGPVLGIGQSAYHFAALQGWRFSVVTTLGVSLPIIEDNIARLGLAGHLGRVRASNIPVLDIETDPNGSERAVVEEALRAEREDEVDAIVLGCAGMVRLANVVRQSVGLHVIDPVATSATCIRWMLESA